MMVAMFSAGSKSTAATARSCVSWVTGGSETPAPRWKGYEVGGTALRPLTIMSPQPAISAEETRRRMPAAHRVRHERVVVLVVVAGAAAERTGTAGVEPDIIGFDLPTRVVMPWATHTVA